ncbi:GFA family protein [Rhizobium tubonense]|uniref:Aldehyde-activating protein n=1 Tax=Rhizobium tubonense TaxID=484088 RepID=A0A2W4EHM9_9HYPH|nr:GFA family protein [Rhizobium tubonense]PZM10620.1 aldehyde-activating protein [Rhizobium tubonense]
MATSQCSCGKLKLTLPADPEMVVVCHCIACQRRTGSAFGVGAFYRRDAVTVLGSAKEFSRLADSGGVVRSYFCTECGSTVYWLAERLPSMIAIAAGTILGYPKSRIADKSVFECTSWDWIEVDARERFSEGAVR